MSYFSKKTGTVLVVISVILLALGAALTLFSGQLTSAMYTFFSQKIFHREFSLDKWLPTIQSFFIFPVFIVIAFNAVCFAKYTDRIKTVFICSMLAVLMVSITYTSAVTTSYHVNSDLACELVLAKECLVEKFLIPTGYYYSTELHALNNQLVEAPLFLFTNDWNLVKTLASVIELVILFFSCWYLLNKLEIKKTWIKLLCCTMIIAPCSGIVWYVIAWGTYYIPHVVIEFFYVGLYLALLASLDGGKKKPSLYHVWAFFVLAFISGLSTVRYLMIFEFPLALAAAVYEYLKQENKSVILDFKKFWIGNKTVFYAVSGFIIGCIGYLFNNIVLQHIYTFNQWSTIRFNTIGDVRLTDIFRAVMQMCGFQENISVLTPSGLVNILVYIGIAAFVAFIVISLGRKSTASDRQKLFLVFTLSTVLFNSFVYFNTQLIFRYYATILSFCIPALAVIFSNQSISSIRRYSLGCIWGIILFTSSFSTMQNAFNGDDNADKRGVVSFLEKSGYTFGFATFWNANIITYLTNGKIEMGNLEGKSEPDDRIIQITDKYAYKKFSTPRRYYEWNHNGEKIFLLLNTAQYEAAKDKPVVTTAPCVYSDDYYRVFEYSSFDSFKKSF